MAARQRFFTPCRQKLGCLTPPFNLLEQSKRFLETAKTLAVDKTGEGFKRAVEVVITGMKPKNKKTPPSA